MQDANLRHNGSVWDNLPPEASEGFLEQAEFGREHPSRKAVEKFLTNLSPSEVSKPKRGRPKKEEPVESSQELPTLLEIPSGSGVEYPALSKLCKYTGMDKTQNLIDAMKRKFPEASVKLGDIRSIPCEDGSFDIVYARAIFEHLCDEQDVEMAMRECFRVASKYAIFSFYLPLIDETKIRWNGSYFENLYSEKAILSIIDSLGAKSVKREFVEVDNKQFIDSYHIFYIEK